LILPGVAVSSFYDAVFNFYLFWLTLIIIGDDHNSRTEKRDEDTDPNQLMVWPMALFIIPFLKFYLLAHKFYWQFHILWHRTLMSVQLMVIACQTFLTMCMPKLQPWRFHRYKAVTQCHTLIGSWVLLLWMLLVHKEDTQISYLEFIKMLHQLLGNYILMECHIMKIYDYFLNYYFSGVSSYYKHVLNDPMCIKQCIFFQTQNN
jgi:hypothetical protein